MSLYLAIDAGGTKAEYILANETDVLAQTRGGTIKRMRVSAEAATEHLADALAELEKQSGCALRDVEVTCIGTAGETVPMVVEWLRQELGKRVGGRLLLLGDVEIALDAVFPASHGVLLLAGTGSNVIGRAPNGAMSGAGGYGPVLADQGSGHRIGEQALREVFRAIDEERTTMLLPAVLSHWKLADVGELIGYVNAGDHTRFSSLAPVVLECAVGGDRVANELLSREGADLAQLGVLTMRKLEKLQGKPFGARFAFAGSVLEHVHPLRHATVATLKANYPAAEMHDVSVPPVHGALWRARHA